MGNQEEKKVENQKWLRNGNLPSQRFQNVRDFFDKHELFEAFFQRQCFSAGTLHHGSITSLGPEWEKKNYILKITSTRAAYELNNYKTTLFYNS